MKRTMHIFTNSVRGTVFFYLVFALTPYTSFQQCLQPIKTFPYNETFENSDGNWLAGGTFSDWVWGTPSKPAITSAGSGYKCWITGGLKNKSYNDGENAWLKSPCFDFTNVKDPYLTFKVFWETEGKYDGANLQFSTDNGATWHVVGAAHETGSCIGENWYNFSPLENTYMHDAWSGNIQSSKPPCIVSGGSGAWLTAKHDVPEAAGKPGVIFRFVFVSGTSCNDFDGFAVDDFMITEAPSSVASFTYNCSSNLRVNFTSTSSMCPISYLWDFDDPSSGPDNTSALANPTHAYASEGNYHVSLTVFGPGNNSSTYTIPNLEIITNIKSSIVTPIRCNGDSTGALTVAFSGDSSQIQYYWDSKPPQTARTATHLPAGKYNVTILNTEGCPASSNIILTEPPPMVPALTIIKPNCTVNNGSIDITMSGGLTPYRYAWSPDVSDTSFAKSLLSGNYKVTVTDNNMCNKLLDIQLGDSSDLEATVSKNKDVSCFGGNDGIATVAASGGKAPYIYSWASGGNTATKNNLVAGNQTATVTDAKGCKALALIEIFQPQIISSQMKIQNTSCGDNNGSAAVEVVGGMAPYQFKWSPINYTKAAINDLAPGKYFLTIKDQNGCLKNDSATIASSAALYLQLNHTDILCAGDSTGSVSATASGGTLPYTFQWLKDAENFNGSFINNLRAGTYNCNVQDATGCTVHSSVTIAEPGPMQIVFTTTPSYCNQLNGSATAAVNGGTSPYSFLWLPLNKAASTLANISSGNYRCTVTDKNNCAVTSLVTVPDNRPPDIFLGNDTTLCPGSKIVLSPGVYHQYLWQDNSTAAAFTVTDEGIYFVEATDERGCTLKDTIKIISDCGFIFFPTAFTPNNDGRNDFFGPFGILTTIEDYSLIVYNRWGQIVFKSNDPFKKWDGKSQGNHVQRGTYVWTAMYANKGVKNIRQKGTVTVVY